MVLSAFSANEKNEDKQEKDEEDEIDPLDAFMLDLNKDKIIEADSVSISSRRGVVMFLRASEQSVSSSKFQ